MWCVGVGENDVEEEVGPVVVELLITGIVEDSSELNSEVVPLKELIFDNETKEEN